MLVRGFEWSWRPYLMWLEMRRVLPGIFFFSSRRRHTRWNCDWSSDVCSSDLAWASHKSFKPKRSRDGDDGSNFHGQVRKNDTHQSTTDPEAKLYRKADGREAKLCYMGHALMENRNGLAVSGMVTQANGTAERRASEAMLKKKAKGLKRITVGEDKAYDTSDHVAALRRMSVTPP